MGTVFNKEEMLVLLQDFHRLTGLRTVVFDTYGMDILSYPPELPAYCKLVRGVPEGVIGCHLCDQNACRNATRRKETVIYTCHAGLIEVITPILIDGAAVGFLLLSHIVQGADEAAEWAVAKERCATLRHRRSGTAQRLRCPAPHALPDAEIGIGPAGAGGVRAVPTGFGAAEPRQQRGTAGPISERPPGRGTDQRKDLPGAVLEPHRAVLSLPPDLRLRHQ